MREDGDTNVRKGKIQCTQNPKVPKPLSVELRFLFVVLVFRGCFFFAIYFPDLRNLEPGMDVIFLSSDRWFACLVLLGRQAVWGGI